MDTTTTAITLAQSFGTGGLREWLSQNVISAVLIVVAILLLAAAHKQEFGKAFGVVAIVIVGLAIAGIGLGGDYAAIGRWVVGLLQQG